MTKTIGILLTNAGTPDAPTKHAVKRYLKAFLSDQRVIQLPRFIWQPLLYGLILPLRASQSAQRYQMIWTSKGAPMRTFMHQMGDQLQMALNETDREDYVVEIGMNYGNPSILQALEKLQEKKASSLIIFPLYPQYSNTTTASSFDRVMHALKKWPALPHLRMIRDYAAHEKYIHALAASVREMRQSQGSHPHLLISFHGIPLRYIKKGDPYAKQCALTANRLAQQLHLAPHEWTLCYQSRFGYDRWLTPSTQSLFTALPKQGITEVDVICPGFAVDCLETLEEIALLGKEQFHQAGGQRLRYIPALNNREDHIDLLKTLIQSQ